MSLDIQLVNAPCPHCGSQGESGWEGNITHNCVPMAKAAGIYEAMWRPDELFERPKGRHIYEIIERGLKWLEENEEEARKLEPPNKWGSYDDFVDFVQVYLDGLYDNLDADVWTYR